MSHFLTRIDLNPRRRGTARLLASPHRIHGAVNACFTPSQRPSRPLWRIDRTPAGTRLYVVSDVEPDPTSVLEEYGWPLADSWRTRDYAPVLEAVSEGDVFAFRLTANPVHDALIPPRPGSDRGPRKQRVAHVTATQQLEWFRSRCDGWGVMVTAPGTGVELVDRRVLEFPRQGRTVTVGTATFEGVLQVSEAAELRRRLVEGIGHAKAYGCGLLTLAPVSAVP
ncbi:CRISPR-associated Cse3 family protein [Salana multivorans]|uniref:CRISPR-associated Cse3 family protein n=1 Tax=Salana multivorans TaxID=120377 RepID=A0A3N2DB07_9MICO|nr:type I-E CRISPR-associated protein Cas6/Cse3/CasE [Salana multivorans]ROR96936.1 CRISPR-associated Cse3 family protein [Salana multivorans]